MRVRDSRLSRALYLLILLCAGSAASAEAKPDWLIDASPYRAGVFVGEHPDEIRLTNGLLSRTFRRGTTVGFDQLVSQQALIRGVKPEAIVEIDGDSRRVGGLLGQPNYAYLLPEWLDEMKPDPAAFKFLRYEVGRAEARMEWKQVRARSKHAAWPPSGVQLRLLFGPPMNAKKLSGLTVEVCYELYDGIPCLSKWIRVRNASGRQVTVDRFTSEILAAVEFASPVEYRGVAIPPPNIHVETDFSFGGFTHSNANRHTVHWGADPDYKTQVNYLRKTPCLLEVKPSFGPSQDLANGDVFESFRAFLLPHDSTDRERRGLSLRRMYRTIAPWVTENPLMMHVRWSDEKSVKNAIDQCAAVGFEMVILTFGSGFNIEDESESYRQKMAGYAAYAKARGVEIGGYSLLSSRRIGGGNDVVSPEGEKPTHGNCPALTSPWGQEYFAKLYRFYEDSGFSLLEHDGSYPGDRDTTQRLPLQKGAEDSRWAQWRIISDFYKFCRSKGVYLNVPDYYYLSGSNKCGMGYREVNWSLPRAQQIIHTRQNIFDGTWEKTPSMGWMFVPLTQYHGGGAAATIEPLDEHLDHYERMLYSNLALGVQACYRGPRLFDTERTRDLVISWVRWFKKYRDILESDLVHGRRADGRDLDWMLHVNPLLPEKGMLVVFNPLPRAVKKTISVDLYFTGLQDVARVSAADRAERRIEVDRRGRIELPVKVEGQGMQWYVIR